MEAGSRPVPAGRRIEDRLTAIIAGSIAREAPATAGTDLAVTGHPPEDHTRWARANVVYIDTGARPHTVGHLARAEVQGEVTPHRPERARWEGP